MKRGLRFFLGLLLLVGVDQLTKYWARTVLRPKETIWLIQKVLSFHYLENRGAVWGSFQGQVLPLTIVTFLILVFLFVFLLKIPVSRRFLPLRLTFLFLLAGAVGNLIDRIALRYVTDFISLDLIHFPVFNIADMYVTFSIGVMFVLFFFVYKEEELEFLPFFGKPKQSKES